ncbi:MAG: hypothetical protein M1828_001843 [Chrysothrix sp. TS-e1954]|nr:MAG: hypothetical protein M1828_001843 [Chrysothrix sp. TS-e1954]
MGEKGDTKRFSELPNKLAAPMKKSLFERQKAEAEARRVKEEAETAAVYEDFVKSFDDEGPAPTPVAPARIARPSPAGRAAPQRPSQHDNYRRSDRDTSREQLPSFSLKRAHDGTRLQNERHSDQQRGRGIFAFEDAPSEPLSAASAFKDNDKDDVDAEDARAAERAARKPTLKLSSLRPGTSQAFIRSLVPSNLKVEGVRIVPPPGPGSSANTERKSTSAIITLGSDTPASDIDTAVNTLQNRYLGWGYYLSSARHLSSSNASNIANVHSSMGSRPFGAQAVAAPGLGPSLSRAPPPGGRGGFAPPTHYAPGAAARAQQPAAQVRITAPSSIKQLRLIHKTLENLITQGPEFEALLMSRSEVQQEEKWAWIWDARSPGGLWYRWRLWQIVSGAHMEKQAPHDPFGNTLPRPIFHGFAPWLDPEVDLPYEFAVNMQQLVSDSAYDSSDDFDSDEDDRGRRGKRPRLGGVGLGQPGGEAEQDNYLNPMQKAKLTYLLSRLPQTTGKLRRGDLARVMAFAIDHADSGGEEVTEIVVSNVLDPFNMRAASPERVKGDADTEATDANEGELRREGEKKDKSASSLIGLYCIVDILSASSTGGVRGAWRYRNQFEQALLKTHVFAKLGRLEKDLRWGRLRIEKWRRSLQALLNAWESGNVFGAESLEKMAHEFEHPPLTREEKEAEKKEKTEKKSKERMHSKWKTVDASTTAATAQGNATVSDDAMQQDSMDGKPIEDLDGAPLDDLDGKPMEDIDGAALGDIDGDPMEVSKPVIEQPKSDEAANLAEHTAQPDPELIASEKAVDAKIEVNPAAPRRQRPKAIDMFADSDDDD